MAERTRYLLVSLRVLKMQCLLACGFKVGFSANTKQGEGEGERGREKYKKVSMELPSVLEVHSSASPAGRSTASPAEERETPGSQGSSVQTVLAPGLRIWELPGECHHHHSGRRLPFHEEHPHPQKLSRPHTTLLESDGTRPCPHTHPTATARAQSSLCQSSSKKDHIQGT